MGFFSSLFGGRQKSSNGLPPEVARIFEKISEVTGDENLQNSLNYPFIKDQIESGLDVDQLPDGIGEFGRVPENPIPVNGAFGEFVYLSLLKTKDTGQRLLFHRLGSVEMIDMYETVTLDGREWDLLFFSMYHPRRSRTAPAGYTIADVHTQPLLYGTNRRVEEFPYGLQKAIGETTEVMIGMPLPPPQVREAEENIKFVRPPGHQERLRTAKEHVQGFLR